MRPHDLWGLMVDILSRCLQATAIESPEYILDDTLESCITLDDDDVSLVWEAVSGTLHFKRVFEGVLNGYCDCLRRNRSDKVSMYLVAYLVMFRYAVLGGQRVRELLYRSTSTPRLVEYLEYMLSPQNLAVYSKPYWCEHYGEKFIEGSILQPIREIAPQVQKDVIQWLSRKTATRVVGVDGGEGDQKPLHATKSPPCNGTGEALWQTETTPRRNRIILPPIEVREMLYTKPEKRPPRIDCSERFGGATRRRESPTVPVGFSFMERLPKRVPKEREYSVCQVQQPSQCVHEQLRRVAPDSVQVRMTNGALRREAHTYLRQKEEQKRLLEEVEVTLHDSREFEEWQRQGMMQRKQEDMEELLNRMAQIKSCANNVGKRRKAVEEMKRFISSQMRAELTSKKESCAAETQKEFARRHSHVSRLRRDLVERRKKAASRVQRLRFSSAAGVRRENEELKEAALDEEERLKEQRLSIIQEIRHVQERGRRRREELAERNHHGQSFAAEETSCRGEGMTTLQEDVCRLKETTARVEEERRARVRALREREREKLDALSRICSIGRENTHRLREEERKTKQSEKAALLARMEETEAERAVEVCEALKQKRRERHAEHHALMRENVRRKNGLLLLSKDASAVEEAHWSQQEHCVVNRLTARQNERHQSGFL